MNCGSCPFTDGCCYTSMPPKVKCTITNEYHYYDDICNCEEARVQKEEVNDIKDKLFMANNVVPDYTDISLPSITISSDIAGSTGYGSIAFQDTTVNTAPAVAWTSCLVCGDDIILSWCEGGSKICPACQKAIKFIKEKFKEDLASYEV